MLGEGAGTKRMAPASDKRKEKQKTEKEGRKTEQTRSERERKAQKAANEKL